MSKKQSEEPESEIPYFQIRHAVEQSYERRKMMLKQRRWALLMGPVLGGAYFLQTPNASWAVALGVAAFGGAALWAVLVAVSLLVEQLEYSRREGILVEQCIDEIRRRGFDTPPQLDALRESASGAGETIQIRTPLPLAIVGAMIAAAGFGLQWIVTTVVFELGLLMLLYLVVVSGQANAALIIRTAIIEIERQAKVAPTVEMPVPPTLPIVEAQPQTNGKHEQAKSQA